MESVRGTFREDNRLAKKVSIYLCHRYSGARLKEIGEKFGIGASGVSQLSIRLAGRIKEEGQLKKIVDGIHEGLKYVNV
jgi:putative transposase